MPHVSAPALLDAGTIIVKNPAIAVKLPKVDRNQQKRTFLVPLAFAAILKEAKAMGPAAHATIALMGMMGLRVSEACQLDVTDVVQVGGYETIRFVGKGGKADAPPMPVPVMHAVHAAIGDRTDGPILLNSYGNRMNRQCATRIIRAAMRRAGVPGECSPHSLRRTFCTSGLLHGVPLRDMQIAMRHVDPKTTVDYDQMAGNLDRHAAHQVAGFLASLAG
jgi:integrase/recombinase XerD